MQITQLKIKNFRSIRELELELDRTTVFIGPNNSGKTAILDALRIALTRRWGQRGSGFTEYDIHLASDTDDPKESPGVCEGAVTIPARNGIRGQLELSRISRQRKSTD